MAAIRRTRRRRMTNEQRARSKGRGEARFLNFALCSLLFALCFCWEKKMKTRGLFGILVIFLTFGITVIGCNTDINTHTDSNETDPALDGTWIIESSNFERINSNGNFETFQNGYPMHRGTYTTSNGYITNHTTSLYVSRTYQWYTRSEYENYLKTTGDFPEEGISKEVNAQFTAQTAAYTVSDNTWTLTFDDDHINTFVRK